MTDFPKTKLDMFTYGEGTESSQEASLALLQYHMGEISTTVGKAGTVV